MRLKDEFPTLNVLYNDKTALQGAGEVDIFIPNLKLAIEINGKSHYEPIFGEEKLKAEQTNDAVKVAKSKELGIDLLIVNTSKITSFKDYKFILAVANVLDKVKEKINENRNNL